MSRGPGERAFRALLALWPSESRNRYAPEMWAAFLDQSREERYEGRAGRARLWAEVARDVCASGARLRGRQLVAAAGRLGRPIAERRNAHTRRRSPMESLFQDLRYAARRLLRQPGFTLAAALTLALGIGANTAIFSAVRSTLLRPLPVPDPGALVSLAVMRPGSGLAFPMAMSWPDYRTYRDMDGVFTDAVAYTFFIGQISSPDGPSERLFLEIVSGNYFDGLRVPAAVGRTFSREEATTPGAGDVIVLSHDYWQQRFGGDSAVVGREVRLNRRPFVIVGVAPESFHGTAGAVRSAAFVPHTALTSLGRRPDALEDRGSFQWQVIARLAPGQDVASARAAVAVQAQRLAKEFPDSNAGIEGVLYPQAMTSFEPSAAVYLPPIAAVFMTLTGLVLLIACANVANLLLARAAGRRKEISIRAALGSGRLRILRQLVAEGLLLSLLGAVGGVAVAWWVARVLSSMRIANDLPLRIDVSLDPTVFVYAFVIAAVTGILAGMLPGLQAARADVAQALRDGGRGSGASGGRRLRSALVVAQVAVSLVLLVAASLFIQSLRNLEDLELGFETENRLMATTDVSLVEYDEEQGRRFYRELEDRVRALPGVVSASFARSVPIGVNQGASVVTPEGEEVREQDRNRMTLSNVVGDDYFRTMGTEILSGRPFDERDTADSRAVAIVNEVLAERLWPGEDPLTRRLSIDGPEGPFRDVVGVAEVSKYNLPGESPTEFLFIPLSQRYRSERTLHVHTAGDPTALISRVRDEIRSLDPDMPVYDVRTMETHIREGKGALMFRVAGGLVGAFGLIGIVLACVGLYGVMAYAVSQQVPEIGVRMALGATGGRILGLVLRDGLLLAGVGLGLGLVFAAFATPVIGNLLVGVGPRDPMTFASVALLLLAVAVLACWLPARRATRVDPLDALRCE